MPYHYNFMAPLIVARRRHGVVDLCDFIKMTIQIQLLTIFASLTFVAPQAPYSMTCTWAAGAQFPDKLPVYGSPGIMSPSYDPGSRFSSCMAMSRVGLDRAYMFGGQNMNGILGDFWMFSVSEAQWTTIHGDQSQSYGVKGQSLISVFPGHKWRHGCVTSRFDTNFYLGLGQLSAPENNVWMYNFTLSAWAWLSGNSSVSTGYSVGLGIEDRRNIPAARREHSFVASDVSPMIVMYSGFSNQGCQNDLWTFNTTSKNWCWINGNITASDLLPIYGPSGKFGASFIPAGITQQEASFLYGTEKLYTFGGHNNNPGFNNEVWVFDFGQRMWAFLTSGPYFGQYSGTLFPGRRGFGTFAAIPRTSSFLMVSGYGYIQFTYLEGLSDIWMYDATVNQWSLLRNDDNGQSKGIYGVQGATTLDSNPPRRYLASGAFTSQFGQYILFGGENYNPTTTVTETFNDVWYLQLPANNTLSATTSRKASTTSQKLTSITSSQQPSNIVRHSLTVKVTPSSTNEHANDSFLSTENFKFILYASIGFAVVVFMITAFCIWKCSRKKKLLNSSASTLEFMAFSGSDYTSTTTFSGHTSINTQTELAIPAFLLYQAGAEFRWHKLIAKGGGGSVYMGDALVPQLQEFGSKIIVKIVAQYRRAIKTKMGSSFDQEISLMHYLGRHENIVGLLGWCDEPLAMLMRYYPLGSLDKVLAKRMPATKSVILKFSLDISRGVNFMHQKGVAHCDLKPPNVLVDKKQNGQMFCALTDFGISQMFSENASLVHAFKVANLNGVSIAYAAPEVLYRFRNKINPTKEEAFAGDVYSVAVILCDLLKSKQSWK